jgi:hypothetical protein
MRFFPIVGTFLVAGAVCAQTAGVAPLLGKNERTHIDGALSRLNMTEADLGFGKDFGKPKACLSWVRNGLKDPLTIPAVGDRLLAAALEDRWVPTWGVVASLLEVDIGTSTNAIPPASIDAPDLDPAFAEALAVFAGRAKAAKSLVTQAFKPLKPEEKAYLAASVFSAGLGASFRDSAKKVIEAGGIPAAAIEAALRDEDNIDPEPGAMKFLEAAGKIDRAALLKAGRIFHSAVDDVATAALAVTQWPAAKVEIETEAGKIRIGAPDDETFEGSALLTIYSKASSVHREPSGAANGLQGTPLSALIDLGGDDRYVSEDLVGHGAALFGVAVLLDVAGDDVYDAAAAGQGSGIFGAAVLEDGDGYDRYTAAALSQGAGVVGAGLLRDGGGNDLYDVGFEGQGFAGLLGCGLLIEAAGYERYLAGGREPDYERNPDRYLSLAQGFSIGMRPFAGGGVGALIDLQGNDAYVAEVYGQGCSYYYSAGFLIDRSGNDTYNVFQYGQGTGVHLSLGLLADLKGHDIYTGFVLTQGAAHDYAVGMLIEQAGNDTYTADSHSQGRAMNNGLAMLVESSGNDAYFGRRRFECQGIGNPGGQRDYGSLALLLDLAGADVYSCGATDGDRTLRPLYGIIYDLERPSEPEAP